jgi:hypothetical protein
MPIGFMMIAIYEPLYVSGQIVTIPSNRDRFSDRYHRGLVMAEEAKRLRAEAKLLRRGAARDALIRKARHAETGSRISEWLKSPGLRPPE